MAYPDGKYPAGLETTYRNTNVCRSFSLGVTTSMQALTGQVCSEVLIINKSAQDLYVYDGEYTQDDNRILVSDGESITIRGITNCDQVSAKAGGSGTIYYRTQYYSNNPSR